MDKKMSRILPTSTRKGDSISNTSSEKLLECSSEQTLPKNSTNKFVFIAFALIIVGLELVAIQWRNQQRLLIKACSLFKMEDDLHQCKTKTTLSRWGGDSGMSLTIPSEIGLLTQMTSLSISQNVPLRGTIPSTIGSLTQLTWLDISMTQQLSGTIPSTIGNLKKLRLLNIFDNAQLTGTIPSELGNLTNITYLNMRNNQLSGTVPSTLAKLTQLQFMFLQDNEPLFGEMPSSLCTISDVRIYINCDAIECSCCSYHDFEDGTKTLPKHTKR
jgi:Leucine-rich repeat (LRR) protein